MTANEDISATEHALSSQMNENTDILDSLDMDLPAKKKSNRYFYTSGTFSFSFERGFKPETLDNSELTKIPFMPSWHKGIVSIHGGIMPVIDILDFVKNQNIDVKKTNKKRQKTYLLKLEHKDYSPIVFSLDSIPHLVNTEDYTKVDVEKDAPTWIESYLQDDSKTIALIDHNELFEQIIELQ